MVVVLLLVLPGAELVVAPLQRRQPRAVHLTASHEGALELGCCNDPLQQVFVLTFWGGLVENTFIFHTTQETMGDHFLLVFAGDSSFARSLRWCRISSKKLKSKDTLPNSSQRDGCESDAKAEGLRKKKTTWSLHYLN